jgi:beta-glucosidase
MKKYLKLILVIIGSLLVLAVIVVICIIIYINISNSRIAKDSLKLAGPEVKTISVDEITIRDLNKNGKLDPYEDKRNSIDVRVNDLISQMTLEEKAGTMFMTMISMKKDGSILVKPSFADPQSLVVPGTLEMMYGKLMNHFNVTSASDRNLMPEWQNKIQKMAERTRLGIPVTLATDPRNHFSINPLTAIFAGDFSMFPEPLGLAAIGDSLVIREFADIARQEYLAVGIRVALHPQADLATEPRWGRIFHSFGEDATLASMLTAAYIKGFQGDTIGPNSVACMTKHFSGGGPQKEGIDPHFPIQKGQTYPGNNFKYHLIPFETALKAGTAQIMPYYGVPTDQTDENVGFAFNKEIITGLLRNKYKFDGIVCTDWGVINDAKILGMVLLHARAWGMEKATPEERIIKALNAGVDQFGGEAVPELLVKLVKEGKISESRIDESVVRILKMKFKLGLFDNPYVDANKANKIVGNEMFMAKGLLAQKKSIVLLKNDTLKNVPVLPLKPGIKIYIKNINKITASRYGNIVSKPELADIAIIRLKAPSQVLPGTGNMGKFIPAGDLDFKDGEKDAVLGLLQRVPTIVDIYLSRPAVIPEIAASCRGLFVNFGANDEAFLEVVFGRFNPQGKLPIELPSSMDAVRKQKEDVPYDSRDPLFRFGYGLHY